MKNPLTSALTLLSIIMIPGACLDMKSKNDSGVLASVNGEELYMSEVSAVLDPFLSREDSMALIQSYTEAWVRDRILFDEARKKGLKSDKINRLVEDYRKSLLIHRLEEEYLKEELDTIVTAEEIDTFYAHHPTDFILEHSIVKSLVIKIPDSLANDTLEAIWRTEDLPALKSFAGQHGGMALLDVKKWYTLPEMKALLPEEIAEKIKMGPPYEFSHVVAESKYFVKILDTVEEGKQGPVSYYSDIIRDRILNQRARKLLIDMRNDLYKSKIRSKNIKIYPIELK